MAQKSRSREGSCVEKGCDGGGEGDAMSAVEIMGIIIFSGIAFMCVCVGAAFFIVFTRKD